MSIDKNKICFIRAKLKDDYVFDAIRNMGYQIMIPYKDTNLFMRCMREAWYRLKLPGKHIWFNSNIKGVSADIFIVKDPLIIPEFLRWVKDNHVNSKVILDYDNRASKSINPEDVDKRIEKWTYDGDDAQKYGMKLKHGAYLDIYRIENCDENEKTIDVLYLGRDKGRLNELLNIKKILEDQGLKTLFHICADRSFLTFTNPIYKPIISYREYLKLLKHSRAILNIVPEGQTSITQREYEAIFDNVKCITNNKGILNFDLYDPSRYFVIGVDSNERIKEFLDAPLVQVCEEQLDCYRFDFVIGQYSDDD